MYMDVTLTVTMHTQSVSPTVWCIVKCDPCGRYVSMCESSDDFQCYTDYFQHKARITGIAPAWPHVAFHCLVGLKVLDTLIIAFAMCTIQPVELAADMFSNKCAIS